LAYTKLRDLVALAIELQSSSIGLTIDEIKDRTERSRATVERMLTGLGELGVIILAYTKLRDLVELAI
jgi:predicted transcriptional regulator